MTESPLKDKFKSCLNGPFSITGFSIGHRGGGTLQFPEETVESTYAGARSVDFFSRGKTYPYNAASYFGSPFFRILKFPPNKCDPDSSYRMGAGILECDISFTKDRGFVCRHSLCNLHTTTNILTKTELAKKCTIPFNPANATSPASALCCTSDITTAEYLTDGGKQDGFNSSAKTPKSYQYGTPKWHTELYDTYGTV
jgi:glycerophosphoryl diester phosphodiesterase